MPTPPPPLLVRCCAACALAVALLASLASVAGCGSDNDGNHGHAGGSAASGDAASGLPTTEATLVRAVPLPAPAAYAGRTYVVHGTVDPYRRYRMAFEYPGLLKRLAVVEGQRVEPEQTLAELDTAQTRLAVAEAELALEQAEADWERMRNAPDTFTASEIENAQRTRDRAEVARSRAQLRLERSVCLVPAEVRHDAVVERVLVEPGEVVAAGQGLLTLVEVDLVRVVVRVPARVATALQAGESQARLRVPDLAEHAEQAAWGPLTSPARVAASADAVRQFEVEFVVGNSPRRLRVGMAVEVELALAPLDEATVLPVGAVTRQDDRYTVWLAATDPAAAGANGTAVTVGGRREAPTYRAKRWSFPVAEAQLWNNEILTQHTPPGGVHLILEGYQGLLDGQPIRFE